MSRERQSGSWMAILPPGSQNAQIKTSYIRSENDSLKSDFRCVFGMLILFLPKKLQPP